MTEIREVSQELKRCPFCGGEASDAGHVRYSRPLSDAWWEDGSPITEAFSVNCITCGAVSHSGLVGGYRTKADAIAAWNRRPLLEEAERGLEAVSKELQAERDHLFSCCTVAGDAGTLDDGAKPDISRMDAALAIARATLSRIRGE